MTQVCTVCTSPERASIDRQLVIGEPMRAIACHSSIGRMALQRHRHDHLPALLTLAYAAEEHVRADDLLVQVRARLGRAERLADIAEALIGKLSRQEDWRGAAAAVPGTVAANREVRACLELLAELQGELSRQPVINVMISAEWQQLVQALRQILTPHPAILAEVSDRLVAIEGGRVRAA